MMENKYYMVKKIVMGVAMLVLIVLATGPVVAVFCRLSVWLSDIIMAAWGSWVSWAALAMLALLSILPFAKKRINSVRAKKERTNEKKHGIWKLRFFEKGVSAMTIDEYLKRLKDLRKHSQRKRNGGK